MPARQSPAEIDLAFFRENGFILIPGVVPAAEVDAVVDATFEFLEVDPENSDTWYPEIHASDGMVEIYQHQALWNTRQYPAIHAAFAAIYGQHRLWVSIDRVNFKPPFHPLHERFHTAGFMHLDPPALEPGRPDVHLHGLLFLNDSDSNQGGFHCLPGWHRNLDRWVDLVLPNNPYDGFEGVEMSALPEEVACVEGRKGDLLIWHNSLPHGNAISCSHMPRLAQYIAMFPAQAPSPWLDARISAWRWREPLWAPWVRGDTRYKERQMQREPAVLTSLGRRLLGLDSWE